MASSTKVTLRSLLIRGLRATPELRQGLLLTVIIGLVVAFGQMLVPVMVQRTIDAGMNFDAQGAVGVDIGVVWRNVSIALALVVVVSVADVVASRRLTRQAQIGIAGLRKRVFDRIHRISIIDHGDSRLGVLVARVTSDPEALDRFAEWGLFSWTINPLVIIGVFLMLASYAWQLALAVLLVYLPATVLLRWFMHRQLLLHDHYRDTVSAMIASFSESLAGAASIRAYGLQDQVKADLNARIYERYRSLKRVSKYHAGLFVVGDIFGAFALAVVLAFSIWYRQSWGLEAGEIVACLLLINQMAEPIAEMTETFDDTQEAAAAWGKVLDVLEHPITVSEPIGGLSLQAGPIGVEVAGVSFSYPPSSLLDAASPGNAVEFNQTASQTAVQASVITGPILKDLTLSIPPGCNVAVVGHTGSGKTTFAKLLCRLIDPSEGSVYFNGLDLSQLDPGSRLDSIRMVPQDGFLFNTTIEQNVAFGSAVPVSRSIVVDSFERLGLGWWLERLPEGLDTVVGERGENLSVGERQLVALARAQLANPGLLVLDEATSAVDPETDQALASALQRLALGRTMITIAHRLSSAETADMVLVFEKGYLVESGTHSELVKASGVYSRLHQAWTATVGIGGR